MKKYIKYALMLMGIVIFSSCEKDAIPMTSTVDLAGEWMVTVDLIEADGTTVEDPYGLGENIWITYNTNADDGKEVFVNDLGTFWDFAVPVACDVPALSFGSSTPVKNTIATSGADGAYYCNVTVTDGKITPGGAMAPHGVKADKFECYVSFDDDDPGMKYYVHGYRRTGFNNGVE